MNGINVISVNPSQSTRAALHPEIFERIARECKVNSPQAKSRHAFRDTLNFITGLNGKVSSGMSAKLLTLRTLTGAGLTAMGIFASHLGIGHEASIALMTLGGSLISGLATRILSTAAMGYFGYLIAAEAIEGVINAFAIIPALIAMIFMILGPGFYSGDQLIRRSLIRGARKAAVRRKNRRAEDRMSYRAFATAD